uniref:SCA7 domain-containing protein n=1 Tax=Callorhinchus milii TaxID=7868 RepID=A0A4W3JHR6_CALMI
MLKPLRECELETTVTFPNMPIFGHCPAHDEFFLVVCNHCGQVVKPQAFQTHCGEYFLCPVHPVCLQSIVTSPHSKSCQPQGARQALQQGWGHLRPLTGNSCGAVTSPCFSAEKECELDKHCGVMDPETKKPCTRSLTCKVISRPLASLHLRPRCVFQANLWAARLPRHGVRAEFIVPQFGGRYLFIHLKASQSFFFLYRFTSACDVTGVGSAQDEPELETPFPLFRFELDTRISSEESEGETAEEAEKLGCRYSRLHPKPIAFCTFGSRMVGRGCYAFDRRLNHLRSALNSMVERHLNSQMWRFLRRPIARLCRCRCPRPRQPFSARSPSVPQCPVFQPPPPPAAPVLCLPRPSQRPPAWRTPLALPPPPVPCRTPAPCPPRPPSSPRPRPSARCLQPRAASRHGSRRARSPASGKRTRLPPCRSLPRKGTVCWEQAGPARRPAPAPATAPPNAIPPPQSQQRHRPPRQQGRPLRTKWNPGTFRELCERDGADGRSGQSAGGGPQAAGALPRGHPLPGQGRGQEEKEYSLILQTPQNRQSPRAELRAEETGGADPHSHASPEQHSLPQGTALSDDHLPESQARQCCLAACCPGLNLTISGWYLNWS